MNVFNPGSAKYRRGVHILSIFLCSAVGFQAVMFDYGTQEHVFTSIQKYLNKKIDIFFDVKNEELYGPLPSVVKKEKSWISVTRVDIPEGEKAGTISIKPREK